MSPWLESLGVALLAAVGVFIGACFSRLKKPYWPLGYCIPFLLIVVYALAMHYPALAFTPPVSWMVLGRTKFAITGFLGGMMLTTPLLKLPGLRDRIAVAGFMICLISFASVWPFLAPAFNQKKLTSLVTRLDGNGICLQSTDYTCGPAAAVTALQRLGIKAQEGELALLAHTTSAVGTPPDILASVLQKQYAAQGLICEYRSFASLKELAAAGLTIAVIKFNIVTDHYVTVLEVNDKEVIVGDPLSGIEKLSLADFKNKWRFGGVVLKRR